MKYLALFFVLLCVPAWAQNTITVRVTDGQKPLAGASVALRIWGEKKWREETLRTDDAGATTFELAKPLDPKKPVGSVTVHAKGFALQSLGIKSQTLDFALQPGTVWRGKVVDEAGAPIAGALVNIRAFFLKKGEASDDLSPAGEAVQAAYSTRSGADGTFEIADIPPDCTLSYGISAHYFAATEGLEVRSDVPVKAVMALGGALTGQVVGLDGKPLAKLYIGVVNSGNPIEGAGEATSDSDGRFVIDSLAPGTYDVSANASSGHDYLFPTVKNVKVQVGQTSDAPIIRAVEGQLVRGIVRDKNTKKPLEGAQIAGVFGPDTSGPALDSSAVTEADGRFTLRVLPGKNTFYFFQAPQSYISNGVTQTLDVNEKTPELVFDLQPAPTLTGTIVNEKNQPIPAQLRLWGGPEDVINSDAQGKWNYQPSALQPIQIGGGDGENGYFEVTSDWKLPVPSTGPITVKVRTLPWHTLRGRVVAPDETPRANIEVTASFFFSIGDEGALGETTRTATTDDKGNYQFDKIRGDENGEMLNSLKVTVKAEALSFAGGGEIAPDGKNWRASDIVLAQRDRQIEGTTSPGARVVAGAQETKADANGKFKFVDLPRGEIAVYAALNGNFGSAVTADNEPIQIELSPVKAQGTDVELGRDAWREVYRESEGKDFYARDWTLARLNAVDGETFEALQQSAKEPPTPDHDWSLATQLAKWAPKLEAENRVAQVESVAKGIKDPEIRAMAWLDAALAVAADAELNQRALREAETAFERTPVEPDWREGNLYRLAVVTERAEGAKAGAAALDKAIALTLKSHGAKTVQTAGYVQSGRDGYLAMYAETVAQGSAELLRRLINNIQPEAGDRVAALGKAVPVVARARGVEAALPLLEELRAMPKPEWAPGEFHLSQNEPQYAFDVAARRIAPLLAATSPARGLELARRISDNGGRARALASVAPFQAPDVAAGLWREAVTLGDIGDAPRFAARAFDGDAKLGRELFELARARGANSQSYSRSGFWAPYAFYLARADAAAARLELEREWSARLAGNEGQSLSPVAMAMSAAAGARALEMARAIPAGKDNFWSLEARRKIGQYLVASAQQRRDWPFDRWGATDTWGPGQDEW